VYIILEIIWHRMQSRTVAANLMQISTLAGYGSRVYALVQS